MRSFPEMENFLIRFSDLLFFSFLIFFSYAALRRSLFGVRRSPAVPFSPGLFCRGVKKKLLTYAIKDTVSVLYWYGILSRNGKFIDKIFGSFFLSCCRHVGVGHVAPNAPLRWPSVAHLTHTTFHRIRPYLAENTILPSDL